MISDNKVTTIDFTLKSSDGLYADICWQRRRAFYCFGSADTREDGDVRSDDAVFDRAVDKITMIMTEAVCGSVASLSSRLALTYSDGTVMAYDALSSSTIKSLLDIINTATDEFAYLDNFRYYL